jgi:hypothetical protein
LLLCPTAYIMAYKRVGITKGIEVCKEHASMAQSVDSWTIWGAMRGGSNSRCEGRRDCRRPAKAAIFSFSGASKIASSANSPPPNNINQVINQITNHPLSTLMSDVCVPYSTNMANSAAKAPFQLQPPPAALAQDSNTASCSRHGITPGCACRMHLI